MQSYDLSLVTEIIPEEDLLPGETRLKPWPLDHLHKADDRRPTHDLRRRAKEAVPVLENLGLATVNQDDGASRRPSGLRKTRRESNSLAHRTTWLRSDFSGVAA